MMPLKGSECYQVLGLEEGASLHEVKEAYRRLALKYHPDKNASKKTVEKFMQVTEAYRVLRTDSVARGETLPPNGRFDRSSFSSKVPYLNVVDFERLLNKWFWPPRYAGGTSRRIRKYVDSLRYFEKVAHRGYLLFSSLRTGSPQGLIFQCLYQDENALKKGLKTIRCKIQF